MQALLLNPADPTSTLITRFEAQGTKLDEVFANVERIVINVRQEAESRVQQAQDLNTQVMAKSAQQVTDNGAAGADLKVQIT